MLDFDRLRARIEKMTEYSRVAFVTLCCERLLPAYSAFSDETGWGRPDTFRESLDKIWEWISESKVAGTHLKFLSDECYRFIPNADDFPDSHYVSLAIHSGGAVYETLQLCMDGDLQRVEEIIDLGMETIYAYLCQRDDTYYEDSDFFNDPLTVRELGMQSESLELLESCREMDINFIQKIRQKNEKGILNLKL